LHYCLQSNNIRTVHLYTNASETLINFKMFILTRNITKELHYNIDLLSKMNKQIQLHKRSLGVRQKL
jgi:hypothetical protein